MPTLSLDLPVIVHHTASLDGCDAPPNSLEAVQASLAASATFIEVDVMALAADDYILVHDFDLESETTGAGPAAGYSVADARKLRIKLNGETTHFAVPLLSDVVALFARGGGATRLQLDFKNEYPFADDEPLHRLLHLIEPLGDRVIVSTGADWQLRKLRKLAPALTLGFDVGHYIEWQPAHWQRDPRELPYRMGAYGYYDDHFLAAERLWPSTADYMRDRAESLLSLVPEASVAYLHYMLIAQSLRDGFNWAEACHARGILLDAWTMDVIDPLAVQEAPQLRAAGVDFFTTNTPRELAKLLNPA